MLPDWPNQLINSPIWVEVGVLEQIKHLNVQGMGYSMGCRGWHRGMQCGAWCEGVPLITLVFVKNNYLIDKSLFFFPIGSSVPDSSGSKYTSLLLIGLFPTSFVAPTVLLLASGDWSLVSRTQQVKQLFQKSITAHRSLLNGINEVSITLNTHTTSYDLNFGIP